MDGPRQMHSLEELKRSRLGLIFPFKFKERWQGLIPASLGFTCTPHALLQSSSAVSFLLP